MGFGHLLVSRQATLSALLTRSSLIICLIGLMLGLGFGADQNSLRTPSSTAIGIGATLGQSYPNALTTNIAGWGKRNTLVLVNTPQFLISLTNVLYNSTITSMILVNNWNSFSQRRRSLRVTVPLGEQKSQYYLTIPYRYAIPLLLIMGIFHWLVADSFFLVSMTAFRGTEAQPQDSVFGIGYSALSIALALLICFLLFVILAIKSWQRYKVVMPVAGSCSIVISAACHKAEREETPHLKKVMWGVLKDDDGEGYGHCAFTLKLVQPPVAGRLYA